MDNKCPVCGAPYAPGEKFCQNCGNKLPEPVKEAPIEVPQEAPAAPVFEAPAAPVYEAPAEPAAPVYEAPAAPVYEAPAAPAAPAYQAPTAPVSPVYPQAPSYPQNVPNYAPKAAPVPPAAPQYAAPPYGAPAYAAAPAPAPKKKKTGLIIGLCAGAAVLIAALVLLYFFVFSPSSVTLSAETATVGYFETIELTAEVSPGSAFNKSVTWTSSDEDIATVWNGSVTGWEAGTCIITATTSNGKSASCTVTVVVEPSSIWLNEYWIDLTVGEKFTLTADVYPEEASDKAVIWTSSDSSVATVAGGVVFAVGEGSCEIIATTSNGVTESCTVDVSAATEPTDPTEPITPTPTELTEYEKLILGDWHLTYVWDADLGEDVPADEYLGTGVSSTLTFKDDRTAVMTLNDETFEATSWEYWYTDEEGDYLYVFEDGEDMYFYYIVEYGELWVYFDDEILTYER